MPDGGFCSSIFRLLLDLTALAMINKPPIAEPKTRMAPTMRMTQAQKEVTVTPN
jgi:hypothetical protein